MKRPVTDSSSLIEGLVADLKPVPRHYRPGMRTIFVLAIAVPLFGARALLHGLRPDLGASLGEPRFDVEMAACVLTGLAAIYAAFWAALPDAPKRILLLPMVPLTLWLLTLGYGCIDELLESGGAAIGNGLYCVRNIFGLSVIPMAIMLIMLRRVPAFRPGLAVSLAALGIASLACASLDTFHSVDGSVMVLVWQIGTIGALAALARLIGVPIVKA